MRIEDGWQELYVIKCYGSHSRLNELNWGIFKRNKQSWDDEYCFGTRFGSKLAAEKYIKDYWINTVNSSFEESFLDEEV